MRKWSWRSLARGALLSVVSVTAVGAEATLLVPLLPSPLMLPARIGPMRYTGEPHDYEDPALGVSYQYGGDGLSLTVYIYDAGISDLADGADTIATCQEFETAKAGVVQSYQNPQLKAQQRVRLNPPDEFPQMREAHFEYEREGKPTISFVWITTVAGHFLKLRLSMNPRLREEVPEARRAVLGVIGEAIKPYLAVSPKPGSADITLTPQGSDGAMEVGLWYVMMLSTLAEESPELAPVCGGEFVPSLETELGVYRRMFKRGQVVAKTKVAKVMRRIDKAGFLEEYLWVERHREAWGTEPPAGLTIPEYQAWKLKKLKRFSPPDLGSLTLEYPRPLPLESTTP